MLSRRLSGVMFNVTHLPNPAALAVGSSYSGRFFPEFWHTCG